MVYLNRNNQVSEKLPVFSKIQDGSSYEVWNYNSGNYLFTTDTK